MRALLLKPDKNEIEVVDFDGTLEHAYKLLKIDEGSRLVQRLELPFVSEHAIYFDEEGRMRPETKKLGKIGINGLPMLLGYGLITGEQFENDDYTWSKCTICKECATKHIDLFSVN